eukprot:4087540-Pyramimonas_sp.AAC.1
MAAPSAPPLAFCARRGGGSSAGQGTERVPRLAECLLANVREAHGCSDAVVRESPAADQCHLRVVTLRAVERA